MGTRADFYMGRGAEAEWLGSIAWDGYPRPKAKEFRSLVSATTKEEWRKSVAELLDGREDATLPADGWPWPWDDSRTTDYAYAFDDGKVHASCFGHAWFDPLTDPDDESMDGDKVAVFPHMKDKANVTLGRRSGLLVFGG